MNLSIDNKKKSIKILKNTKVSDFIEFVQGLGEPYTDFTIKAIYYNGKKK